MEFSKKLNKKEIETIFPFSLVSELAYKESNAKRYYRPVLTLHKWFARRLGSVFRSILIYSGKESSEEVSPELDSRSKFLKNYLREYKFKDLNILDPFMGGGTTIVEAIRLGFRGVIGGDLNPVSWFTVKKEIDDVNIDSLKNEFYRLSSILRIDLLKCYKTRCLMCSELADAMYYFWIKEIKCEKCEVELSLFRSYLFAYERNDSSLIYVICPRCEFIFKNKIQLNLTCPSCDYNFNPHSFIVKRGKYFCPNCHHSGKIVNVINRQGRVSQRMYGVEYYCHNCKTRNYKRIDNEDLKLFNHVKQEFAEIQKKFQFPHQKIPVGIKTQELLNHGFHHFLDMFNERQLFCLGKIISEILKISDINIREFFLITFSTSLEYNNLLCEYHRKNHYIYNLFRKHAFPATLNPVENNVWGTKFGTGTFSNFFEKTITIKKYCQNPYEYYIDERGETKRKQMKQRISAKIVTSYSDMLLNPSKSVYLYCNSSNDIEIPENSVDLVVTDPPYYDNVQYAELSDFYYVWLRLGLKKYYPWFQPELSPKENEIVKNLKIGKTSIHYQKGLIEVFSEIKRVLKHDGLFIFTFHHKKIKAWLLVIESLLANDFYITSVYPVRGEMKTSTQIHGTSGIEFDAIFVCRKRQNFPKADKWENLIPKIEEAVYHKISLLKSGNDRLSKNDTQVIKLSIGLKYLTEYYPNISKNGKALSLTSALEDLIHDI